ncbi:glycoside hydrolase family 127 protein [Marinoscillum sp. MHG1-6]|uniref:glycoside hydrolase family 127 protein n=1 Tax=Marinoscillum sp. MHG1-6 TaxID=2959627 RepID=UPI0021583CDD|nr:glycoside hydrolase family 127 protein [Marinoscillum sp. MHG1-6]
MTIQSLQSLITKTTYTLFSLVIVFQAFSQNDYPIKAIPFYEVKMQDSFWQPRMETARKITIPATFQKNEETFRVKLFEIAAGVTDGEICTQYPFDDTDVYKSIEGAAYALKVYPDAELEAEVDRLIQLIGNAQEEDGYLYTWRTIYNKTNQQVPADIPNKPRTFNWLEGDRWENVDKLSHELYNVGHLYEAAVAYYEATGKRKLLDIALKNAELVYQDFGPGKLEKAPGHQEVEVGLIKLYRATNDERWLDLAKYFIDVRGYGEEYSQNHQNLKDQRKAVGHAVRLGYMFMGAADVAALTGSKEYDEAMISVWEDIVGSQIYLTGGVGATGSNEGFGGSFDLPNYTAYNETCSSISFVLWSQRMFQLTGESRYLDVLELTIYNALNAGLSLSGDHYFYPNPLESRKNVERTPWFGCACCPPNLSRFYNSLSGLFYGQKGNDIYITQYAASQTSIQQKLKNGQTSSVSIRQETNYPWDGKISLQIDPEKALAFTIYMRIPGWAQGQTVPLDLYMVSNQSSEPISIKINGKMVQPRLEKGFIVISRKWKKGDLIEMDLPMEIHKIRANEKVESDKGRFALKSGPLVYCLEGKDQEDDRILSLLVPDTVSVMKKFDEQLFGGIITLNFNGYLVSEKINENEAELEKLELKAIPYFMWANRGKDNMLVWLPYTLSAAREIAQPSLAYLSSVDASEGVKGQIQKIADQYEPQSASDHESSFVHWWPQFGTTAWLKYEFPQEEQVGTARIYFFDDEDINGGCRIPKSIDLKYLENGKWRSVYVPDGINIVKDGWTEIQFEPVKTTTLKLEMTFQEGVSGGVHEWGVY